MRKSVRESVFNKYGGRCAYCGCELVKGWHVDHAEPAIRKKKHIPQGYFHKETGEPLDVRKIDEETLSLVFKDYQHRDGKYVADGFRRPENDCVENYMPACASCNINKHDMNIEDFRSQINGFLHSLNERFTQYKFVKRYGLVEETNKPVVFYFETLAPADQGGNTNTVI